MPKDDSVDHKQTELVAWEARLLAAEGRLQQERLRFEAEQAAFNSSLSDHSEVLKNNKFLLDENAEYEREIVRSTGVIAQLEHQLLHAKQKRMEADTEAREARLQSVAARAAAQALLDDPEQPLAKKGKKLCESAEAFGIAT